MRPHIKTMEELLNQISVIITRDQTVQIFISKIDLDLAYRQTKLIEETSRQCVSALTGGKLSANCRKKSTDLLMSPQCSTKKVTEHSEIVHQL